MKIVLVAAAILAASASALAALSAPAKTPLGNSFSAKQDSTSIQAANRKGSKRVGGTGRSGKGSRYVGGRK